MKLKIDNFGPISNYTFEINDINLLIGESATGKSIVTKLIYICNTFTRFISYKECDKNLLLSKFQLKLEESFKNSYSDIFQDAYNNFDFTFFYTGEKYINFSHNDKKGYKVDDVISYINYDYADVVVVYYTDPNNSGVMEDLKKKFKNRG
jgi:predicted ATPase